MKYSLLDLSPVPEGSTAGQSIANSADLARMAEAEGYHRYWLAEHHNMPGIASSATALVIGHVAAATKRMRVGSGGIMLPNHAPLVIAEQFGTLAEMHPGRIDLGLGRAPGTDMGTARALRRNMSAGDTFPQDVVELMGYLGTPDPEAKVRATPGEGTHVPVWILGSSLYGAQLAAHLGLPYAFASHFAPDALEEAAHIYRTTFRPGPHLEAPHFMMAMNVFAGADDAEGAYLKTSMQQTFIALRTGNPGKLQPPVERLEDHFHPQLIAMVDQAFRVSATGGPETVRARIAELVAQYQPDELMIAGQIFDHEKRKQSFRIAAEAVRSLGALAA